MSRRNLKDALPVSLIYHSDGEKSPQRSFHIAIQLLPYPYILTFEGSLKLRYFQKYNPWDEKTAVFMCKDKTLYINILASKHQFLCNKRAQKTLQKGSFWHRKEALLHCQRCRLVMLKGNFSSIRAALQHLKSMVQGEKEGINEHLESRIETSTRQLRKIKKKASATKMVTPCKNKGSDFQYIKAKQGFILRSVYKSKRNVRA